MKLSNDERDALDVPIEQRELPLCRTCGLVTYPSAWCQCDPRLQMEACLIAESREHGVILRVDEEDCC